MSRLRGHRRLRAEGARGHGARRHARCAELEAALAARAPDARLRAAAFRRRAPRSAARWPRASPDRAVPTRASVRDFVLGTRIVNGKGEDLSFGGRVIKNVAGYDVSRLMAGALGTLGVITEISFKVLPRPAAETTLAFELDEERGDRAGQPLGGPAAAAVGHRVAGRHAARAPFGRRPRRSPRRRRRWAARRSTRATTGTTLREHRLPFFSRRATRCGACRCRRPPRRSRTPQPQLIEWGGGCAGCAATGRRARRALDRRAPRRPRDALSRRRQGRRRLPSAAARARQDPPAPEARVRSGRHPQSRTHVRLLTMQTQLADWIKDTPQRPRGRRDPAQVRALRLLPRHLSHVQRCWATSSTARAGASTS